MIGPAGFMAGPKANPHVCQHTWMDAFGKRKSHLMLCPCDSSKPWRQSACGQFMLIESEAKSKERCQACERSSRAERRNEQS